MLEDCCSIKICCTMTGIQLPQFHGYSRFLQQLKEPSRLIDRYNPVEAPVIEKCWRIVPAHMECRRCPFIELDTLCS